MLLPTEGHLSVMMEGSTSSIPCRRICQLAVCQLLSSGSQVVYLEGLNGCQIPVKTSLPESLSKGVTMLEGESTLLQVDLLQSATKGFKVLSLGGCSNTTPAASPTWASPPKTESQVSMTMEVSKLLSQVALDTSSQALGGSTPKRPVSLALASSFPLKPDDSTKLVDSSSQVSIPDKEEVDNPMLIVLQRAAAMPPLEVTQLQEEANKSLGCLLATRSTIDAHRRKEISDFGWPFASISLRSPKP